MISSEVVNGMIDIIEENMDLIEKIRSQDFESFSNNFRDIQAAKHSLQESIDVYLDIGSHIISEKGFQRPENYRDIYKVLEQEGIIDRILSEKLQEMDQFRNLLVQRYARIDTKRVYEIMSGDILDIREFEKKILKYIS